MKRMTLRVTGAIAFAVLVTSCASAQTLNIWPGVAPGSEQWIQEEITVRDTPAGTVVLNVVTPTLTAYLPQPGEATGISAIVAPGGYCVALAIDSEGHEVARWLQKKGIAAFVLKYRTQEKKQQGIPKDLNMDNACKYGIADAIQAIKVVRQHAPQWDISPEKVGILGFSAGGMIASSALLQEDAVARPNFAALLYGAPFGQMPAVPARLPPVFMAWARDDALAGDAMARFQEVLAAAGGQPEVHLFSAGGHGFGMQRQGTTSDHWMDEFYWWLQAQGLLPASR